jgi:hypothetical protein
MTELTSSRAKYVDDVLNGVENPFATLEALGEHVQMLWMKLGESGVNVWETDERGALHRPKGHPGEMVYHLNAVDQYRYELLNGFSALLPELHDASEGDQYALELIRSPELTSLRDRHEREWQNLMSTFKKD